MNAQAVRDLLGWGSLLLGIVIAIGALAKPRVTIASLKATIDLLLLQKRICDDALAGAQLEVERLKAQNKVLLEMRDRRVAAGLIKQLVEEGVLLRQRVDLLERRHDDDEEGGRDGPGG